MIQRYVSKVSGPLLDRIDIHIEVPAVEYKELHGRAAAEGSAVIRERVLAARRRQHERVWRVRIANQGLKQSGFAEGFANDATQQIRSFCVLESDAERMLERAMHSRD